MQYLCKLSEIAVGSTRLFQIEKTMVTLIRTKEDEVVAMEEHCSHRAGPLSEGALVDGCIVCPWHGSRFDLATGAVVTGPAKRNLVLHSVEIRGAEIYLQLNKKAPAFGI